MKRIVCAIIVVVLILTVFGSCVPGEGRHTTEEPANLWWGIWHGWVAPISLIVSWFKPEVSIYERNNTGFWYELGFYMAIISGFGGISLSRRKKRHRDEE